MDDDDASAVANTAAAAESFATMATTPSSPKTPATEEERMANEENVAETFMLVVIQ
jgi:hypothetical protein